MLGFESVLLVDFLPSVRDQHDLVWVGPPWMLLKAEQCTLSLIYFIDFH